METSMTLEEHVTMLQLLPDNQKQFDLSEWEKGAVLGPEMLPFCCLILLGGLLPPSQGLLNLGSVLGLSPAQSKDGILGGEGLGNGLLGNKNLLGEKGLLGTDLLGKGGLLGNGSLLGLDGLLGEGGLLGDGVHCKSTRFAWLSVLNLENVRVSWKVLRGGELVLNLYSKLAVCLPGIFQFLSGSSVETNITSHIALTQDTPGDLKLVIKDCNNLLSGFNVNLRKGFLTNLVSRLLNSSLQSLIPALLCPLVNIWVSIINIKLQFLNRVIPFGLLGKIHSALSNLPLTSGQFVELDLQKSPFPSAFINWLLQTTAVDPGSIP
ncbi:BPI fold-containing family B member 4-like [Grus americana]|uniref:BPI fold-containing family B member 4-like n=1 Tax=Grus americana TaxID=9117 RepID=UPI002407832B|nr:BPI fold-containing family B member 4-like [Grus americana]